jgi:PhnB protein
MKIPDNHQAVMPYLILNNAAAFLEFTGKVFHSVANDIIYKEDHKTIMHAEITISGSTIMFAQATTQYPAQTAGLFIYVEDADETFASAVQNGARVILALEDKAYGRSGGIQDPSGNTWWITSSKQT